MTRLATPRLVLTRQETFQLEDTPGVASIHFHFITSLAEAGVLVSMIDWYRLMGQSRDGIHCPTSTFKHLSLPTPTILPASLLPFCPSPLLLC